MVAAFLNHAVAQQRCGLTRLIEGRVQAAEFRPGLGQRTAVKDRVAPLRELGPEIVEKLKGDSLATTSQLMGQGLAGVENILQLKDRSSQFFELFHEPLS